MSEKTYNGWTNYETWNVNLWMNSDGSDSHWRERAEELMRDNDNDRDEATRALADEIKDSIEEANPVGNDASMFSDLMSAVLSEVNWHETADHYVLDVEVEEPEPDEPDDEKDAEQAAGMERAA